MDDRGGSYSEWYVGIAEDPKDRLFNDHNVRKEEDYWIYDEADSHQSARNVEDYFVNTLKTKGGLGGGSSQSKFVYAYKTDSHTNE